MERSIDAVFARFAFTKLAIWLAVPALGLFVFFLAHYRYCHIAGAFMTAATIYVPTVCLLAAAVLLSTRGWVRPLPVWARRLIFRATLVLWCLAMIEVMDPISRTYNCY